MSFARQLMAVGYPSLAAQISFYFLLSIFPGLLLVSAVLTLLPRCADYYFEIRSLVESLLPKAAAGLLQGSAAGAHICETRAGGAISLSLLILLLSGSNVFVVVM
ncbi:MAG TPA: YhjD/YihY/BrkB family envelope integrity protein, partial [Actinomycetota bacterium]|nr:YhjD/YihY/BrkB family envelope integrity protein [Actinomycetota bacterium]